MICSLSLFRTGVMQELPSHAELHLIVEKPFVSSPKGAKELITLKNEKHLTVLVAENFRYDEEKPIY